MNAAAMSKTEQSEGKQSSDLKIRHSASGRGIIHHNDFAIAAAFMPMKSDT
jgi:hypothetical protein